jgi:RND family efflux transporter MFP subunit
MGFAAGCSSDPAADMPALPPPVVSVSYPIERQVQDFSEFTGRTAAVESVKVRARVWGHLQKINFVEGAEVKKGDLLYIIDQRPYRAALSRAEAEVAQTQARVTRLEGDIARARNLLQSRAISREEFDKINGDLTEAHAATKSAAAAMETARLNLDYTEVHAPVDGQISRTHVTIGNLVESGENGGTHLTTIVSLTPVYAYFDVDDLTYLRIKPMVANRKGKAGPPVQLAIGNETGFPHEGTIDFVDNQVDPGTGTLRMRGVFANDKRALTPGLFAKVRVPLGGTHQALLVTDRAIETDQGLKVVYTVNGDNLVDKRAVRLGRLHDGFREIVGGVKAGERIVVDGIQRVRPGGQVNPKLVEMPVYQGRRPVGKDAS